MEGFHKVNVTSLTRGLLLTLRSNSPKQLRIFMAKLVIPLSKLLVKRHQLLVSTRNLKECIFRFSNWYCGISDATPDCAVPVEANQHALDNTASEHVHSKIQAPRTAGIDDHNLDKSVPFKFQRYITGKVVVPFEILYLSNHRYQTSGFLVRQKMLTFCLLVPSGWFFLGLQMNRETHGSRRLLLKCEHNIYISLHSKVLTPVPFRPADTDGLTIVATSEDPLDFAYVSLTKDELGLGQGTHEKRKYKCILRVMIAPVNWILQKPGITKSFKTEAGAPSLQLSFAIIGVPEEETISENPNDDDIVQIGRFILQLRRRKTY